MTRVQDWYMVFCDSWVTASNWILYTRNDKSQRVPRPEYVSLQCNVCGKIDELKALKRRFSPSVSISGPFDIFASCEDLICVSGRFIEVMKANHVTGIRYAELPGGRFFVAHPGKFINVDESKTSQRRALKLCQSCGRPRERLGFPSIDQCDLPNRATTSGFIWPPAESIRGCVLTFVVSSKVKDCLIESKLRGYRLKFWKIS